MSQLFASGGQRIGVSASNTVNWERECISPLAGIFSDKIPYQVWSQYQRKEVNSKKEVVGKTFKKKKKTTP